MQLITTKTIGALGRIVIPSEVRDMWDLKPGTEVGIYIDSGKIIIRSLKEEGMCFLCGRKATKEVKGKFFCYGCIKEIIQGEV